MKTSRTTLAACAALFATLAACGHEPRLAPSSAPLYTRHASAAPVAGQRTSFDSVDAYKADAAEHILRYNADHTFSGKLPPMLPAIVVVNITVDQAGRPTKVAVQRSRDNNASKVALASVHRAGVLPRPFNLATGPGRSLTYSETFLFNADYRFQLRTLAPVQTSD
jgi:protein TonB